MARSRCAIGVFVVACLTARAVAAPVVYQANGPTGASILSMVDAFRGALGPNNGGGPGPFPGGRREINWDGVSDLNSVPFPGDFFNQALSPRARGAAFSTPGTSLQVSLSAISGSPEFADIDASYLAQITPFSGEKLFTPIGSVITDVAFFVPGNPAQPGLVSAFGAVFSDVDLAGSSWLEYYDENGALIHTQTVPGSAGAQGFSFAGVHFDAGETISRVRIYSGNTPLAAGVLDNPAGGVDVVVMDDFIYSEPTPLPEPEAAALALAATGALAGLWLLRRERAAAR